MDIAALLTELYPLLGATGTTDLEFWTEDELYRFCNDAAKRLARNASGFVERAPVTLVAGTYSYALPARHLSSIHGDLDGASLRSRTIQELDALDENWRAEADTPWAFLSEEFGGQKTVRMVPNPIVAGTFNLIFHRFPTDTNSGAHLMTAPLVLKEYFRLAILGEARGKEGKAAMPEVAAWLGQLTSMFEQAASSYWGVGE